MWPGVKGKFFAWWTAPRWQCGLWGGLSNGTVLPMLGLFWCKTSVGKISSHDFLMGNFSFPWELFAAFCYLYKLQVLQLWDKTLWDKTSHQTIEWWNFFSDGGQYTPACPLPENSLIIWVIYTASIISITSIIWPSIHKVVLSNKAALSRNAAHSDSSPNSHWWSYLLSW